ERFVETLPSPVHRGLEGLLRSLDVQSWLTARRAFADAPLEKRFAILESWRQGDPVRRLMLRALVSPLKMAHFDDPGLYQKLGCVYEHNVKAEAKPAYMRDRVHAANGHDLAVECDVVVIGTGAGGAVVGRELAEAGLAV